MASIEAGCFMIVAFLCIPFTTAFVWHFFPWMNVMQAGAAGIVLFMIIYLMLQKIFARGEFEE